MSAREAFGTLLAEATNLVDHCSELAGFSDWDIAPRYQVRMPSLVPAIAELRAEAFTSSFHRAVCAVADYAHWQRSYSEDQVGADFLNRYGWFELIGPNGHFHSPTTRGYVAYWGRGLYYPNHWHAAEEIYYVTDGAAEFISEGAEDAILGAGRTRTHSSNQPHALETLDQSVLCFVLWRGKGFDGKPYMPKASEASV